MLASTFFSLLLCVGKQGDRSHLGGTDRLMKATAGRGKRLVRGVKKGISIASYRRERVE